ncbi:MAG: DJ-1 family protein [Chitinivibrionales bacterium]|nr:DJ-1 family protein [Chitinivibrionales bacterium]
MSNKVLVPIAHGTEEIEAVSIIDVLRRAGADVTVAAVGGQLEVKASRGVSLVANRYIQGCTNERFGLIALPGGAEGAENLRDSKELAEMLKHQDKNNNYIGAICASPAVVLLHHEILRNRKATCYPKYAAKLENQEAVNERVVVDQNIITSQGPGTALEFSITLVKLLFDEARAQEVGEALIMQGA